MRRPQRPSSDTPRQLRAWCTRCTRWRWRWRWAKTRRRRPRRTRRWRMQRRAKAVRAVRAVVSAAPQEDHAQAQATAAAAEEEHAGRLVPKGRSALRWRRQRGELAAYLAAEGAELAALDVPVGAESLVSPGSLCGSAMRNQDRSLEEVMQRGRWNQGGDQRNAGLGRGKGADGRTASGQWASRGVRRSWYAGNGGELHTAAWPRLSRTAQWAQRRAGTGSVNNNPRLLPSYLSYFGKFADLRTGQNWTFGVPNDLLCLSVGSKIIVDCGASSSRGGEGIHRRAAERSFRRSRARASVGAEERSFDHGFRAPGRDRP